MKRLTYREEDGRALLTPYGATVYCSMQATADCFAKLEEKLAAYENTGLEPEAIEKLKEDLHVLDLLKEQVSDAEESIRIAEARRDGRLIVLPCKVGDTVYTLKEEYFACERCPNKDRASYQEDIQRTSCDMDGRRCPLTIEEHTVEGFEVLKGATGKAEVSDPGEWDYEGLEPFWGADGKWYLTREDAEKALEAQNGD